MAAAAPAQPSLLPEGAATPWAWCLGFEACGCPDQGMPQAGAGLGIADAEGGIPRSLALLSQANNSVLLFPSC